MQKHVFKNSCPFFSIFIIIATITILYSTPGLRLEWNGQQEQVRITQVEALILMPNHMEKRKFL